MNFTYRVRSLKQLSYPERLAVLNVEPLELGILKADLIMYFKIVNNLMSIYFNDHLIARTSSSISIRSLGSCILKPNCRTNRTDNNFFLDPSMFGTHYQNQ